DRPGVMLAGAMRDYLVNWAVSPAERTVVVTNNDDGYRTALALVEAGLAVPAIVDPRPNPQGALPRLARERGVRVASGRAVAGVNWHGRLRGVTLCAADGDGAA